MRCAYASAVRVPMLRLRYCCACANFEAALSCASHQLCTVLLGATRSWRWRSYVAACMRPRISVRPPLLPSYGKARHTALDLHCVRSVLTPNASSGVPKGTSSRARPPPPFASAHDGAGAVRAGAGGQPGPPRGGTNREHLVPSAAQEHGTPQRAGRRAAGRLSVQAVDGDGTLLHGSVVEERETRRVRVRFDGWSARFDEWYLSGTQSTPRC